MSGSSAPIFDVVVQQVVPASLTVGLPAPLGMFAPSTMPPSTIYTASGALAPTDRLSVVNSAAPVTLTLAAGTVDGQLLTISNVGAGIATIDGTFNGGESEYLPNGAVLRLAWSSALNFWVFV